MRAAPVISALVIRSQRALANRLAAQAATNDGDDDDAAGETTPPTPQCDEQADAEPVASGSGMEIGSTCDVGMRVGKPTI